MLAAGLSARFGSDKRRAEGDWQGPLLHHVLGLFRPCFTHLGVVIGPDDSFGGAACAAFAATPVVNPAAADGMGGSLAMGIAWLAALDLECAVVGLADMPWVPAAAIRLVSETGLESGRLVAPVWQGRLGFPRAIPSRHFPALASLRGERGASALLDWENALLIPWDEPGVFLDIDHPADADPPPSQA